MKTIERHIDKLFKPYKKSKYILELKEEVYSNLLARKEDLELEGYSEEEAVKNTINYLNSIEHLIEENKVIDMNVLLSTLFQSVTLYTVLIWIGTLPLSLFPENSLLSFFFMLLTVLIGIVYLSYLRKTRSSNPKFKNFNIKRMQKLKKVIWQLWGGFIVIILLSVTGIYFASNIWFSRPVTIDGPYEFATIATSYLKPFAIIIIPLTMNRLANLVEESEEYLNEEN
ncbi:hypothetical protein ACFP65_07655 [Marinilactibacillus sp. GCM10026970]|uniref:hypothetical protein n=1 Tax=Marinilactibacillus sp. GCM10026970 TaxID=3252642 RepID=UPI00360E66A5